MATGRVSKRTVEAVEAPPKGQRAYLWDDTLKGFGIMVTDRGARSYLVQYRIGGRGTPTRRVTIGKHGSPWTAEKARARACELLEQVRRRVDPFDAQRAIVADAKEAKRHAEAARVIAERLGFSTFADRFVEKYAKVEQPRTWADTESIVRRDLKPHFGDTPLPSITSADVVDLLDKVQERGNSAAIKAYKVCRNLFGYAVDKEKRHMPAAASPMLGIKPPAHIEKRDRALTDDELRLVWVAAGGLGWPFGPIVRLLILTGQRLREVSEAPWKELDLDGRRWLLPKERSKNGVAHLIPLTDPALEIVKELPRLASKAGLIFTTTGETPVSGFSRVKRRLDASMLDLMRQEAREAGALGEEIDALTLADWRLHDLRRTLASGCQRLGVRLEVSEAVLNHVSGTRSGIAGVYHVYRYEDEKRAALEGWARHVQSIVAGVPEPGNVYEIGVRAAG